MASNKKGSLTQLVLFIGILIGVNQTGLANDYMSSPPPLSKSQSNSYQRSGNMVTHPSRRITLNFTSIKTRELLQIIAQFTNLNFVLSDDVKGSMSIHLKNVPWQQALHVILTSQSLGQKRMGAIVFIAPKKELARQEIENLQAKKQVDELAPVRNRIIKLRYAEAEDIAKLLSSAGSSLLSSKGTVGVDKRTNSIWIRDTSRNIGIITPLVRRLDIPVKQVMIEARVVKVDRNYERSVGAKFGITSPDNLSGTLTGANQMLAAGGNPQAITPLSNRLNFNLPASPIGPSGANPATIGLALAKIGSVLLDLELSALEETGHADLIDSPRLITSNQHPAYIKVGEEIPYQQATSSGATAVEFKDAVLQLEVTPQITPDHRVILHLKVSNNKQGDVVKLEGGGEAIPIDTQEEQSTVLLNDHQTVVFGGVYQEDKRNVIQRVPILGEIPIIGYLFSHQFVKDNRTELLIFLTPHIIHSPNQLS